MLNISSFKFKCIYVFVVVEVLFALFEIDNKFNLLREVFLFLRILEFQNYCLSQKSTLKSQKI